MSNNRRPHVFIPGRPLDAQQPAVPRGQAPSEYTFHVVSPPSSTRQDASSPRSPMSPQLSPLRRLPTPMTLPPRPRMQSASDVYPTTTPMSFPEPQFYRSPSASHRESLSLPTSNSVASFASSYAEHDQYGLGSPEVCSQSKSPLSS